MDGLGKSTQVAMLAEHLSNTRVPLNMATQPSKNRIGKFVREALVDHPELDQRTLALLFAADINDSQNRPGGIVESLSRGRLVIGDRGYLSIFPYQMPECSFEWLRELHKFTLIPDLTIYFEASVELSFDRVARRGHSPERFETLKELKRVKRNFAIALELLEPLGFKLEKVILTGTEKKEEVHNRVKTVVNRFLETCALTTGTKV